MAKKKVSRKKTNYKHSHHHHHASNNLLLVVAGGFIVLVILMYMVASTNKMNRDVVPAPEVSAEANSPAATVVMENGAFSPPVVTIKKGQSVEFANNDDMLHNAKAVDGSFSTQDLALDTAETITFDTPGKYEYECTFHPGMSGTIVVEE